MTYVMYKLYKRQKIVKGEWVDDTTVEPSIDANGNRDKVISFTSDASCYNGEVTDERWVDDGIIEADCFQDFEDFDDTKQEYLGCKWQWYVNYIRFIWQNDYKTRLGHEQLLERSTYDTIGWRW